MSLLNPLFASCHTPVASCAPFEDTDAESQSNASLIAAAPELLTGLEYRLQQTVDMDLAYGIELTAGERDARERAIAAIAKARTARLTSAGKLAECSVPFLSPKGEE